MAKGKKRKAPKNSNYRNADRSKKVSTKKPQENHSFMYYLRLVAFWFSLGGGVFWLIYTIMEPLSGHADGMLRHFVTAVIFFAAAGLLYLVEDRITKKKQE